MRFTVRHESAHTIRVHAGAYRMSMREADILRYYLENKVYVTKVSVYEETADAVITYNRTDVNRERLLEALSVFSYNDENTLKLIPEETGRALDRSYGNRLVVTLAARYARKLFLPAPLNIVWTVFKSAKFIYRALKCLGHGKVEVPVLDACAVTASMLMGDFNTASSIMCLLDIGDILEQWTYKKSVGDLARSMTLKSDKVWLCVDGTSDVLADTNDIKAGDLIRVSTSMIIPFDGRVRSGEMTVNQASMTGESIPVPKHGGGYVYAGTVVDEGECVIEVTKVSGDSKFDQIVRMIEDSEKLKSATEARAYHLADSLVPYSLLLTASIYLLTGNVTKAMASLMVDFSCALKLSMPLAVLSAIKEARISDISIKGGKSLEAVSEAQTVVFDKTGTLTYAQPKVARIVTFDGMEETEALRISACLEEHFPHSMANAVVEEAKRRSIIHDEMHSKVKYVVAHGIASEIDGKPAVIGSRHFVFEDENCKVSDDERGKLEAVSPEYSHLYMAVDGRLKALICISDPLKKEASRVIRELHELGINRICMMTGDNAETAAAIAEELDLDEFHAGVLPEDKALFIRREHEAGRTVIMIGDGVNDAPALSEADAGIAINTGAAIAKEISDITISADDLEKIVTMRRIADALMNRINSNYRFIISFNGLLIALGIAGVLRPATSALIHNTSTIIAGLNSMTPLLTGDK